MKNISYHTIDPYSYKFIIASITNEKESKELVSKFKIDDPGIKRLGGVYTVKHDGWNTMLVFFNFIGKETLTYGMVAHEALHIVDTIFNSIGQEYDPENNEVGAYLIEWIVNKIFIHMKDNDLLKDLSSESIIKEEYQIINKIISKQERKSL